MKIFHDASRFDPPAAAVTIGMFDGVHRGHRRVLKALREEGDRLGVPTVLLTFDPHPRAVLRPQDAPALLVSLAHRLELLAATGAVDHCLVLPFDRAQSERSARDFVARTLVRDLRIRSLVVGANFRCGRGRTADVATLRDFGAGLGFGVRPIELNQAGEAVAQEPCSSSAMRRLIESGDIVGAAAGLERPHEMTGTVSRAADARRVIEVTLPTDLCTPAAADYAGSVRNRRAVSPWVPAWLQVRHGGQTRQRTVRLIAREAIPAAPGDLLALRFHTRRFA